MKKFFAVVLSALVVSSSILTTPVSAGWDRRPVSHNGATGYLYCSTGVDYIYPAGYTAAIEDDSARDFEIYLRYTQSNGASGTDYNADYNDYLYLDCVGVSIAYVTGTFTVDGSPISYFADAR